MAAVFYAPLVATWCEPGAGLVQAAVALGGLPGRMQPYVWSLAVRAVGRDIPGLGVISMVSAFVCVALIMAIAWDLMVASVWRLRRWVPDPRTAFANDIRLAAALTALAFVFTPGYFHAATRIGPLMTLLALPLAGLTIGLRLLLRAEDLSPDWLKRNLGRLSVAAVLLGFGLFEIRLSWGLFRLDLRSHLIFAAIGVFPFVALTSLIKRRTLLERTRRIWFFSAWTVVVCASAVLALSTLDRGRAASRLAARILENAAGCRAVVSDGVLDATLYFMTPDSPRLILFARDEDPAYSRSLADWVQTTGTNQTDLVLAAGLGPRALVDEWARIDPNGLDDAVRLPQAYFPTVASWRLGCAELSGVHADEPYAPPLRKLMGFCGNHLGCRCLERGDEAQAWDVFWEILERIDVGNQAALANLLGMVARGYAAEAAAVDRLKELRQDARFNTSSLERFRAAWTDGRVFADPQGRESQRGDGVAPEGDAVSSKVRAFLATVSMTSQSRESALRSRETIRKGVQAGRVKPNEVGFLLLELDRVLGDWESAEADALVILRFDRDHAAANAMMGMRAGAKGDYPLSERYLRRALAGNGNVDRCSVTNDLAFTLARLKRFEEAEALSRASVVVRGGDWRFHATLAHVLICAGKTEEGKRELLLAERLAEQAGHTSDGVVRFSLDHAWLHKMRGDKAKLADRLGELSGRRDLTASQRMEMEELCK